MFRRKSVKVILLVVILLLVAATIKGGEIYEESVWVKSKIDGARELFEENRQLFDDIVQSLTSKDITDHYFELSFHYENGSYDLGYYREVNEQNKQNNLPSGGRDAISIKQISAELDTALAAFGRIADSDIYVNFFKNTNYNRIIFHYADTQFHIRFCIIDIEYYFDGLSPKDFINYDSDHYIDLGNGWWITKGIFPLE